MSLYLTHQQLVDRLSGEVAADWRNIGYGLLPFNVVKNLVDGEASGCQGRLDSTLQCWLEAGGATMEGLIRAVQSPSVGPNQIHKELMKMLKDQGPDNHPLTIEDAGTLRVVLSPLAYDWFLLGIQLQIEPEVLKRFEHLSLPNQSQRRLSDLIGTWIKQGKNVTLEKLTEVLAGDTVRQRALALKLKTEYKGHKIVMKAPGPEEVASREEEAAGEDQMDYEVPSLNEQIEEVPGGIN